MKEICRCALSVIKKPATTCCLLPIAVGLFFEGGGGRNTWGRKNFFFHVRHIIFLL